MAKQNQPVKKFNRLNESIGFAVMMTIFFIINDIILLEFFTPIKIIKLVLVDLLAGAVAGFFYGWVMDFYFKHQNRKNNTITKE